MATAIAARHVYKHRGTGITGHYRPACAESRPRRRQRPADLEPCSTRVFDGLPAQTIWIKFSPETSGLDPSAYFFEGQCTPGQTQQALRCARR